MIPIEQAAYVKGWDAGEEYGFKSGYAMGIDVQRSHHTALIEELLGQARWKGLDDTNQKEPSSKRSAEAKISGGPL